VLAAGIEADQLQTVVAASNSRAGGRDAALALLAAPAHERPTAVLSATDVMALGVLDAARDLRIDVPRELSVVGFDDVEDAARSTPPLTTVDQGLFHQGKVAARLLLDMIEGRSVELDLMPARQVRRASTAPPPGTQTVRRGAR
jgi:DNA-binding LacI/PurR family transcriptional regulator